MTPLRKTLLKAVERLQIDFTDPDIDVGVAPEIRGDFNRKVLALKSYGQGVRTKDIEKQTRLTRQQIRYYILRLEVTHPDGQPLGLRALQDGSQRAREYKGDPLMAGKPVAGAQKALFRKYPAICEALQDLVLYGKHPDYKQNLDLGLVDTDLVYELMTRLCLEAGIQAPTYPFCGNQQGRPALRDWIKRIRAKKAQEDLLARVMKRRPEDELRRSVRRAYACVQADAHSIAVKWTLRVPSLRGEGYIDIVVTRLWVITLIDCTSSTILGHSLAFSTNYSGSDLMRAVRSALVPWKPMEGYEHLYKPADGMPTGDPDLLWRAWDLLKMDSAMAHTCSISETTLARTVNCVVEVGPVGEPNERAYVEGFYALFDELVKLMPGFQPKPHERDSAPLHKSSKHAIDFDLLVLAINLLIARYNGSVSPGTSMTHLEMLKHSVSLEAALPRRVPVAIRDFCLKYDSFDTATVGKDSDGKPVLRWQNASYTGLGLATIPDVIGQEVLIGAYSMDLRKVHIWLVRDGQALGFLDVEPRYRATPHSATTRAHIKKLAHADSFFRNAISLPLALRQMVEARKGKRTADYHELARLVIEQAFHPSVPSAPAAPAPAPASAPAASSDPAPASGRPSAPKDLPTEEGNVVPFIAPPAPDVQPTHLSSIAKAARALGSL